MKKFILTNKQLLMITSIFTMLAGFLYAFIQFIHPLDALDSVSTTKWVVVASLTMFMSLSFLIATTQLFVIQREKGGLYNLVGFVLFAIFWIISMMHSFVEASVLPLLVDVEPEFISSMTGIFGNSTPTFEIGIFPALATASGILYALGGMLMGISTIKSKLVHKIPAYLLTFSAIFTLATAVIPHPYDRLMALPLAIAVFWIGYDLFKSQLLKTPLSL